MTVRNEMICMLLVYTIIKYLAHADRNLYLILKHLETGFEKHVTLHDVFEDAYNEIFSYVMYDMYNVFIYILL